MPTLKTLNRLLFIVTLIPWLIFSFGNKLGFVIGVTLFVLNWVSIYRNTRTILQVYLATAIREAITEKDIKILRTTNTKRVLFSALAMIGVILNVAIFNFGDSVSIADKSYMLICGVVLCYYISAISDTLRNFTYRLIP